MDIHLAACVFLQRRPFLCANCVVNNRAGDSHRWAPCVSSIYLLLLRPSFRESIWNCFVLGFFFPQALGQINARRRQQPVPYGMKVIGPCQWIERYLSLRWRDSQFPPPQQKKKKCIQSELACLKLIRYDIIFLQLASERASSGTGWASVNIRSCCRCQYGPEWAGLVLGCDRIMSRIFGLGEAACGFISHVFLFPLSHRNFIHRLEIYTAVQYRKLWKKSGKKSWKKFGKIQKKFEKNRGKSTLWFKCILLYFKCLEKKPS